MKRWKRASTGALAALALAPVARGQIGGDFTLDPKTYASPSGEVVLSVDPSRPSGGGPATYRCTRAGEELWSGQRPYTLWEAQVTDEGVVAGYAYGAGYRGGREDSLTIVVLAPDGRARLEERTGREGMLSDLGSPDPMVKGMILDPARDRLVVRTTAGWSSDEVWRVYALSTGERGPDRDPRAGLPDDERLGQPHCVRPVPSTSLDLVEWWWSDYTAQHYGAVFTLLDPGGTVVWRLDWPDDHVRGGDRIPFEETRDCPILATEPDRFVLLQRATNERVTFQVERIEDGQRRGLDVREIAREPFTGGKGQQAEPSGPTSGAEEPPALALEHLGTIELGTAVPPAIIRDVMSFALDGRGRPGFLRRTEGRYDFVRVDADGENAVEIPLPVQASDGWWFVAIAWTAGERWVVAASGAGASRAWWIDAAGRGVTAIPEFEAPRVESLARTPEGGFVVLGTTSYESGYFTSDLVVFGPDGQRILALGGDQGDPGDPRTLFAPTAVTVLANGEMVVLSNIKKTLQFFSPTGEFLRVKDLEAAWGREPNYPTDVHTDVEGGLVVHDFDGTPSIVRIDGEGAIVAGFDPRYPDGRSFRLRGGVQVGPDGTPWTSDGHSLLVLDREGVVQRVLGSAPDSSALGEVARLTIGPDDRVYAADRRTAAVHVFDASGKRLHVCVPDPRDFEEGLGLTALTVTDAGEVYLGDVHFAADGSRLGRSPLRPSPVSNERYAQRGTDRFWVVGYEELYLTAADGQVVRKIERTPDGRWLRGMKRAGVAPDGSIALATGGTAGGIHLYSASGEPARTLVPPAGMAMYATFAFDGERLAIGVQEKDRPGAVVLMDASGRTLGRFTPEGEVPFWLPFFAARGEELWLFDGERRIERFALP